MQKENRSDSAVLGSETSGGRNKNLLWSLLSLGIAAVTIWAVTARGGENSLRSLLTQIAASNKLWFSAAICCMLGFIIFEACAIRDVCRVFRHGPSLRRSWVYSSADIYFSAITPSATGGQPACAVLMMLDGIPGTAVTAALIMNLTMYTLSIVVIGFVCFLSRPGMFLRFGVLPRVLIVLGCVAQLAMGMFFFLLVKNERLLRRLCRGTLHLLARLHLLRREEERQAKLEKLMEDYRRCVELLAGERRLLLRVFLYNLLQRTSQIAVTMFVYLALGGGITRAFDLWAMQGYVVLGSNSVPIPGGMGVADYLMLDGLGSMMTSVRATELALLSRSVSFYSCILLCGAVILLGTRHNREKREFGRKLGNK